MTENSKRTLTVKNDIFYFYDIKSLIWKNEHFKRTLQQRHLWENSQGQCYAALPWYTQSRSAFALQALSASWQW